MTTKHERPVYIEDKINIREHLDKIKGKLLVNMILASRLFQNSSYSS